MAASEVEFGFAYGTLAQYKELEEYDENTLYFITDVGNTGIVYKGSSPFGTTVKKVSTLPQTGEYAIVYILDDSSAYYWTGSEFTCINAGLVNTIDAEGTENDSKGITQGALKLYMKKQLESIGTSEAIDTAKTEAIETAKGYTDQQINAKIASVFRYMGAKDTKSELDSVEEKETGHVWHINEDGKEYVYNGSEWELLGFIIDLSNYATNESVTQAINAKADALVQQINAYSKTEIDEKLAPVTEHMNNQDIHPSLEKQQAWDAKASTDYVDSAKQAAITSANAYTDSSVSTVNDEIAAIRSALTWKSLAEED